MEQEKKKPDHSAYRRFRSDAGFKIWRFKLLTSLIILVPASVLSSLLNRIAASGGLAVTTANLGALFSWRLPFVLVLGIAVIFLYVVFELFSVIYLCDDLLNNRPTGVFHELKRGFQAVPRFFTGKGAVMLIFVLIAVPLVGVGFSISLTERFYIPRFIADVVFANPLCVILYTALLVFFALTAWRWVFAFHAVLIDNKKPSEATALSRRLTSENRGQFAKRLLGTLAFMALGIGLTYLITVLLPSVWLKTEGQAFPAGCIIDLHLPDAAETLTEFKIRIILYRIMALSVTFTGFYIFSIVAGLLSTRVMLEITRNYFDFTSRTPENYRFRIKAGRKALNILEFSAVLIVLLAVSMILGLTFDQTIRPAKMAEVIAHRTGGVLASENSLEGIDEAVKWNCHGAETDFQRTKDGYYIVNHDSDFERLTGDARKPGEMTRDEIRELRIKDTTGSGALLPVPEMEEILDRGKGKIILYLELKGESADRQMVDDVVKAVKERDMVSEVALISLKYDIIDYAETTYPEFKTGVLIFSGIGDVSSMNCDMVIMEEEMASDLRIEALHNAGKEAGVWTVNTEEAMKQFLVSGADVVITDQVTMAFETRKKLEERTDLDIILDTFWGVFD